MTISDCGCNKKTTIPVVQEQTANELAEPIHCSKTVNDTVTAAAECIITPDITITNIQTSCIGAPSIFATFPENISTQCSFTVEQNICAQFDFNFGVNAVSGRTGLVCGTPSIGSCNAPINCSETSTTGPYALSFNGVTNLAGGRQEWSYQLTNNSVHDLSHWTLVSCSTTPITILSVHALTSEGNPIGVTFIPTNNPEGSINCLTTLPQRPGVEITPDPGSHTSGTTITYHIVTAQVYPVSTVLWGAKAGQDVDCGDICGPCQIL